MADDDQMHSEHLVLCVHGIGNQRPGETVDDVLGGAMAEHNRLNADSQIVADETIVRKGEFVIVVAGVDARTPAEMNVDGLLRDLRGHLPAKEVAAIVARATGLRKNALYQRVLELESAE